jgi:hypothetical protein
MGKKKKICCGDLFHLNPNVYDSTFVSGISNNETYFMYLNVFTRILMNRFRWKNLPNTCSEEMLEKSLCQQGKALFFFDEKIGFLTLPFTDSGRLNIYGNPVRRIAYSPYANYRHECYGYNSVIIYNNYMRMTEFLLAHSYALRIANAQRICDVNISGQKKMKFIACDESKRLSYKNVMKDYDGNEPMIFGSTSLDIDDFKTLEFSTDDSFLSLYEYKKKMFHEFLTFIGVNNTDFEKGERLVSNEVDSNNEIISMMKTDGLEMRKKACDSINKKFELNVSVEWNPDIEKFAKKLMNPDDKGGDAIE